MAIEISSQAEGKKTSISDFLLYFLVFLTALFVAGYIIMVIYQKNLENEAVKLSESLRRTESEQELEQKIFNYERKFKSVGVLLNERSNVIEVFDLFEKSTHPQVWFSKFSFHAENKSITVSGQAASYEALGQQLLIFKDNSQIKSITLSGVSLSKEVGKTAVDFSLSLSTNIGPEMPQ